MLGERYGWMPDAIPAEVAEREPWEGMGSSKAEVEGCMGEMLEEYGLALESLRGDLWVNCRFRTSCRSGSRR